MILSVLPRRYEIHGRVFGKDANPRAALRKTPSCRRAALAADSAQHWPFLRKLFNRTVAVAVIYCTGSLPNGAAGDGRREERRREGGEDKRRAEKRGKYDKENHGVFQCNNFRRWNLNIMRWMPCTQSAEVVSASCS